MLIDEKNSQGFFCPFTIPRGGIPNQAGGCVGDKCMAWREVNTQRGVKGYCGLAGMPVGVAQPLLARGVGDGLESALREGPNGAASHVILPPR